jgi:hypothetical protein
VNLLVFLGVFGETNFGATSKWRWMEEKKSQKAI